VPAPTLSTKDYLFTFTHEGKTITRINNPQKLVFLRVMVLAIYEGVKFGKINTSFKIKKLTN